MVLRPDIPAAVVEVKGYKIAASITAMPHAGRDDKPANINVSGRSGGYGWGTNLDFVKGNGWMDNLTFIFTEAKPMERTGRQKPSGNDTKGL